MTFRKPSLTIMIIIILSVCDIMTLLPSFCVSMEIGACACVYLVCPAPMLYARAITIRYSYRLLLRICKTWREGLTRAWSRLQAAMAAARIVWCVAFVILASTSTVIGKLQNYFSANV